jgi:hypothetical protein
MVFAKAMEEKVRQMEVLRHHIQTLENAAWNAHGHIHPQITKEVHMEKPHDGDVIIALRQLPMLIDTLVAQEVKKTAHVSMKEALLRNCQSVKHRF